MSAETAKIEVLLQQLPAQLRKDSQEILKAIFRPFCGVATMMLLHFGQLRQEGTSFRSSLKTKEEFVIWCQGLINIATPNKNTVNHHFN